QEPGREGKWKPRSRGSRSECLPGLGHQLGAQMKAEVGVERRSCGPRRLEEVHHFLVGRIGEEFVEFFVFHQGVPSSNSGGSSRRNRSTPRWSSSLTAPELLPRIWAISSIFRSLPNFSTMAPRCCFA